jgi:serine/threonine-protein kinase
MMTPGTVVGGKYLLSRLLGQGAMGEVWAAVNRATGGEVALKLLSRPREDLRHRLIREARACGRIRHRNVIHVHDVGVMEDGEPFLVMELLSGETLAGQLERQRRIPHHRAARIARDVARALEAAHQAGIVHRDLKPANVFLHREEGAEDVVVKVLDFGVSKSSEASDALATVAGMALGSPAYMSPEQARAAADLDHRTDLWSLGVVLFEMLAGQRPFDGDARQILERTAARPAPLLAAFAPEVDPTLAGIVACCLEREPARRFGSAGQLAEALERCLRAPPPLPRPAPPAKPKSLLDTEDMPTMKWQRGLLPSPPPRSARPDETPVNPVGPTLPDPVEVATGAPTKAADVQGAALFETLRLDPDAETPPPRPASVVSSMAPLVHPSSAPAAPDAPAAGAPSSTAAPSRRGRLAASIAIGALALALGGVSLARVIRAPAPAPAAPEDGSTAAAQLPFAAPSVEEAPPSREEPRTREEPRAAPSTSASAPAPRASAPVPDPASRPLPKATRPLRRDDGGKAAGAPPWLRKAITPSP